ncbi:MAG: ATP-binding protein [Sphingomonadaceae bacterium]|nr:ATP-binding protein [Sphingomonadaceae bacterium]
MTTRLICIAGAESTGKSWLAARLAQHYGAALVNEYARAYCAEQGNNLSAQQLRHVGEVQDMYVRGALREARHHGARFVVADTDALVTATWADMAGFADPWFETVTGADLYLITDNDLPWIDDGVRIQRDASARDNFRERLIAQVTARGHNWLPVGGHGDARLAHALLQIASAFP